MVGLGGAITASSLKELPLVPKRLSILWDGGPDQSAAQRVEILSHWFQHFSSMPFTGVGVGTISGYPHNLFIELITFLGLVGAGVAIGLLVSVIFRTGNALVRSDPSIVDPEIKTRV